MANGNVINDYMQRILMFWKVWSREEKTCMYIGMLVLGSSHLVNEVVDNSIDEA